MITAMRGTLKARTGHPRRSTPLPITCPPDEAKMPRVPPHRAFFL
jgi:hypothetical protein